ncbi:MAG TPA: RNA methyltransferase [Planctomycetota bacterium]|nr:RNA methyltransferase [Planctomycetota bacterium]
MNQLQDLSTLPMLSSPQNPRVKEYVELRTDGNIRRDKKRFLLEGKRAVAAALNLKHVTVHEIIYADHLLQGDLELVHLAASRRIPLTRVTRDVFKKIADVMTPQGIAAVVKTPEWDSREIFSRPDALIVVACGLQDPGNVGTIIRSCEAAGASALVTLEGTADPFNAKVVRATAAGLLVLPILRFKTEEFLEAAMRRSLRLVATSVRDGVSYRQFDWTRRPIALCIGSEGEGLSEKMERACQERVTIPMKGEAESLNAAVATSILLFQAMG